MKQVQTFNVAGTSILNGKTKVRFANDFVGRFKVLDKNGHEDIHLIELGEDLTKEQVCQVLLAHKDFQTEDRQTAIVDFVVRNFGKAKADETKVEAAEDAEAELA